MLGGYGQVGDVARAAQGSPVQPASGDEPGSDATADLDQDEVIGLRGGAAASALSLNCRGARHP